MLWNCDNLVPHCNEKIRLSILNILCDTASLFICYWNQGKSWMFISNWIHVFTISFISDTKIKTTFIFTKRSNQIILLFDTINFNNDENMSLLRFFSYPLNVAIRCYQALQLGGVSVSLHALLFSWQYPIFPPNNSQRLPQGQSIFLKNIMQSYVYPK